MEDRCNTGGTRWLDKDGNEITEKEYMKLQNKTRNPAPAKPAPVAEEKEVVTDDN